MKARESLLQQKNREMSKQNKLNKATAKENYKNYLSELKQRITYATQLNYEINLIKRQIPFLDDQINELDSKFNFFSCIDTKSESKKSEDSSEIIEAKASHKGNLDANKQSINSYEMNKKLYDELMKQSENAEKKLNALKSQLKKTGNPDLLEEEYKKVKNKYYQLFPLPKDASINREKLERQLEIHSLGENITRSRSLAFFQSEENEEAKTNHYDEVKINKSPTG